MTTLDHVISKLFSGRWIWAVSSAYVFVILACSGMMTSEDIKFVLGFVLGAYFQKPQAEKEPTP